MSSNRFIDGNEETMPCSAFRLPHLLVAVVLSLAACDKSPVESTTPVGNVIEIAAGRDHTCALTTDGTTYCWGANGQGQLGAGGSGMALCGTWPLVYCTSTPVRVPGPLRFAELAAGGLHTCGLTPDGSAYCWGYNGNFELGRSRESGLCVGERPTIYCTIVPGPVSGGLKFATLSAGSHHNCGITSDRALFCWGGNYWGQVGTGSSEPEIAEPVQVLPGTRFASVDASTFHTCAVSVEGAAYCWGWNLYGELGVGAASLPQCGSTSNWTCSRVPLAVAGGVRFTAVAAGDDHTCALDRTGAAWCWGSNAWGQLGGESGASCEGDICRAPVRAAKPAGFTALVAGDAYTCGLSNRQGTCWGGRPLGQVEDGSSLRPDLSALSLVSLRAGGRYACAITVQGEAYCWGHNWYGQTGAPLTVQFSPPGRIDLPSD